MTIAILPPVGSVWVHRSDPHDIAIVVGYDTIIPSRTSKAESGKNNAIKIHKVNTNTQTIEVTNTFTWKYKPLENK